MGVKIFVGNLPENISPDVIRQRFERVGKVLECDILGSYGFVHMEKDDEADEAIRKLDKEEVNGNLINVEKSKTKRRDRSDGQRGGYSVGGDYKTKVARRAGCTKLHIANVPEDTSPSQLRRLFERYGRVVECDVLSERKIAFVHIAADAARDAIRGLNGYSIKGEEIKVKLSNNQPSGRNGNSFVNTPDRGGPRNDRFPPRSDRFPPRNDRFNPQNDRFPPRNDHFNLPEFNLPLPPPDFIRILRERAVLKLRLPSPSNNSP